MTSRILTLPSLVDRGAAERGARATSDALPATGPICVPGRTCMAQPRADRVSFLVDGDAYFRALTHALAAAKKTIWIVGWDIDSRVEINRGYRPDLPRALGAFLDAIVAKRGGPDCFVLAWDFAWLYALEREALTATKLGWKAHRKLRYQMDDIHPVAGSHHQKFVVVDDQVAFVGGMDLCGHRWDTTEHKPGDPRRKDPWKPAYGPFHDAQAALSGDAARVVGDYARERWHRATGQWIKPTGRVDGDAWPAELAPDLRDVDVAIARTDPAYDDRPDVRECEQLYVQAIRAARRTIFVENQYLTSYVVQEALLARLVRPDCPEIVILQPRECCGWLEQTTMGILRARLINTLRAADAHGRLRIFAPVVPDDDGKPVSVNLHTKIMIVDDRFVRVGSANMSNRSLGLDTELDVAVEVDGGARAAEGVRRFRARLLAEHLGCTIEDVEQAMRGGSLIRAIDALRGGERTLVELEPAAPEWLAMLVPENFGVDPETPSPADQLVSRILPLAETRSRRRPLLAAASVLALLCALAAMWKFTPLAQYVDPTRVRETLAPFVGHPLAPALSVLAFVVGGFLMLPVTLLVFQAGVLFGPALGFPIALSGALCSAAATWAVGRFLGKDVALRLAGRMKNRVGRIVQKRSALAIAALRLVPVAPFTIVNLACGASRVRFRDYMVGTLLGMAPGILALTVFSDRLVEALADPTPKTFVAVAAATFALLVVGVVARRALLARRRREAAAEEATTDTTATGAEHAPT
jgi:phospholipase D1/2